MNPYEELFLLQIPIRGLPLGNPYKGIPLWESSEEDLSWRVSGISLWEFLEGDFPLGIFLRGFALGNPCEGICLWEVL